MRIVHVSVAGTPVLHRYGGAVQREVIETAVVQAGRGEDVVVYSPGEKDGRQQHRGVEVRSVAVKRAGRLGGIALQRRVVADVKDEHVDILHFHSQFEGAILGRRIAAKKVLSYNHFYIRGGRKTPLYPLYRHFLGAFDALLPISEYCFDGSRRHWRIAPDTMQVVPNGVNTAQFRPDRSLGQAERAALGIQKRVVLYVGRVCHQKGTDVLIDACERLNERREDIQLVVAGPIGQFGKTDDSADGWEKRIRQVGGIYLGPVAEEKLCATYNMADIFVMPTRTLEMFGMAAVEAQACGKPVIASDHGGLIETVPDDCGARFPVGDARALAAQIAYFVDHQTAYEQAAANALRNGARYDWERIVDQLAAIYRGVPVAPATHRLEEVVRT